MISNFFKRIFENQGFFEMNYDPPSSEKLFGKLMIAVEKLTDFRFFIGRREETIHRRFIKT